MADDLSLPSEPLAEALEEGGADDSLAELDASLDEEAEELEELELEELEELSELEDALDELGGSLELRLEEGQGTTMTNRSPKAASPET